MSLESNGMDRVCSLRKIPMRLRGTNFCTSLAHFVLSFVSQPNCPNFTKIIRTHQKMSLGSNGVDRVRSLRKISTRLRGTTFCTSSVRFAPSFVSQPNGPKCTKIVWNTPKHEFRVQWGGSGALVVKNSGATSWHELLHQLGPFCTEFCKSTKRSPMHQNCMKGTKRWVWGPMVWIGCIHYEKFRRDFVTQIFAPDRSVLYRVS